MLDGLGEAVFEGIAHGVAWVIYDGRDPARHPVWPRWLLRFAAFSGIGGGLVFCALAEFLPHPQWWVWVIVTGFVLVTFVGELSAENGRKLTGFSAMGLFGILIACMITRGF
jgi:hypothetical protein